MSPEPPTPRPQAPRLPLPRVTAAGLRAGDPLVLATLAERRGADVLAYVTAIAPTGEALRTAAEVFVAFRVAAATDDAPDLEPAAALLAATRRIAARRAENPFRPDEHRRPAERTAVCDRFPHLLIAWAAGRLTDEEAERLREHVVGCPDCDALNVAFDRAEVAFRDGPAPPLRPEQTGALIAAAAIATTGAGA